MKISYRATFISWLVLAIFGCELSVQAIILPVAENTSSNPKGKINSTTGTAATLTVSAKQQAFLIFDLSTVPARVAASNITSARLNLFVSSVTAPGELTVHAVTNAWQEITAGVEAPGYSSNVVGAIPAASLAANSFIEVDVTEVVSNWFNGTTNFGFAIATATGTVHLGSKEGLGAGFPALLEIELTDATLLNVSQLTNGILPLSSLPGVVVTNNETGVTLSGTFNGNGSGLTNLPGVVLTNKETGVTLSGTFNGNGSGLTNLPGVVLTNNETGVTLGGTFNGNGSGLTSLPAAVVTNNETGVTLSGTFSGNGVGLTNFPATALTGTVPAGDLPTATTSTQGAVTVDGTTITISNGVIEAANGAIGASSGNSILSATNAFIGGGTSNTIGSAANLSFIGGGSGSTIQSNAQYATIAGGQQNTCSSNYATVGGGYQNRAQGEGDFVGGGGNDGFGNVDGNTAVGGASVVGGGVGNNIGYNARHSFIGSGYGIGIASNAVNSAIVCGHYNNIGTSATGNFIGGGYSELINSNASDCVIGGGNGNSIGPSAQQSVIVGGNNNLITNANNAFIGGGQDNTNMANYAVIPGGSSNLTTGTYSFAAGQQAQATNQGAFVWADSQNAPFGSATNDSFNIRAQGGVFIYDNLGSTAGVTLASNATAWTSLSDRNAKKNFQPVDAVGILDKLAAIPIQQWNYKWEKDSDVPNIGPMAQDFKGAFYPGRNDRGITTLEFDGVELAAIQGLNQKLEAETKEKDAEIEKLKEKADKVDLLEKQNNSLTARLNELEAAVKALAEKK